MRQDEVIIYTASWVLPVEAPAIEDGAVVVRDGVIAGVGDRGHILKLHAGEVEDSGDAILMPGFVNAHTHLELSALEGEVETGNNFVDWVRQVVEKRQKLPQDVIEAALVRQICELEAGGTALLGDVTNTGLSARFLTGSGLRATIFHELIGFRNRDADEIFGGRLENITEGREDGLLRRSISPHGPHSVSPGLMKKIIDYCESAGKVSTVHLAESPEEDLFIREGKGPFLEFLVERGVWDDCWEPCPGGPVSYLDKLGFLRPGVLCVHLVQAGEDDLTLLAERGAAACICPRSNNRTGVGRAPVEKMLEAGLLVALGTDSLAGNDDLNVLAEAQYIHRENPRLRPEEIVRMFTINGARALGWKDLGGIAEGKAGSLALVQVEEGGCKNPYEYLLEEVDSSEARSL